MRHESYYKMKSKNIIVVIVPQFNYVFFFNLSQFKNMTMSMHNVSFTTIKVLTFNEVMQSQLS